jgi:hypothetical protein
MGARLATEKRSDFLNPDFGRQPQENAMNTFHAVTCWQPAPEVS